MVSAVDPKKANSEDQSKQSLVSEDIAHPLDRVDQEAVAAAGPERQEKEVGSHFLDLSQIEPFVKPGKVGEYLDLNAATVVRFAARGILPGHPLRESGNRCHWRFLLSEVRKSMLSKVGETVRANVREDAQRKAKYG